MASDGFPYPVDLPGNFSVADKPKRGEHWSDCAVHSEPTFPAGLCNCGAEADQLRAGIAEIIAICEQDARDQDHSAETTGFGRGSKAYAEGRGTACRRIAARLKALLPLPNPPASEGETP